MKKWLEVGLIITGAAVVFISGYGAGAHSITASEKALEKNRDYFVKGFSLGGVHVTCLMVNEMDKDKIALDCEKYAKFPKELEVK